jgi:phosphoribosylformylglycinamidine synthase
MCFGNKLGFEFSSKLTSEQLYSPCYGAFIIELTGEASDDENVIGKTTSTYRIDALDYSINLDNLQRVWEGKLEPVFPCRINTTDATPATYSYKNENKISSPEKFAKPRVVIPVFPGTNCEYDTARAFEKAGAAADMSKVSVLVKQKLA